MKGKQQSYQQYNVLQPMKQHEVKERYDKWKNAMISTDITFLEKLYDESFIATNTAGKIKNKREQLLWLQVCNVFYRSWTDKNLTINFSDNNALIKSNLIVEIVVYDQLVKIEQEINLLFRKQNEVWQLYQYNEKPVTM